MYRWGKLWYLVKFLGWSNLDNMWLPHTEVHTPAVVKEFQLQHPDCLHPIFPKLSEVGSEHLDYLECMLPQIHKIKWKTLVGHFNGEINKHSVMVHPPFPFSTHLWLPLTHLPPLCLFCLHSAPTTSHPLLD